MKCPNCGYNSFDYLEICKKCGLPLNPSPENKSRYKALSVKARSESGESQQSSSCSELKIKRNVPEPEYALDSDQDVAVYHKREDLKNHEPFVKTDYVDNAHTKEEVKKTPELSAELSNENEAHEFTEDPLLYSESPEANVATNFGEATQSAAEEDESYSIASLKIRAAAFAIDIIIVGFITFIAIKAGFYFLEEQGITILELNRVFLPIYVLLFFLASTYFIFLHYFTGRTIGKMVMGIKLISSGGRDIGLWESFMRWVGYYISAVFLFAGFVWSIFDPESQAWHDKIAGTYVVIG